MSAEPSKSPASSSGTAGKLAGLWALATGVVCLGLGLLAESRILEHDEVVESQSAESPETSAASAVTPRIPRPSTSKTRPDSTSPPIGTKRTSFSPPSRDEPSAPLAAATLRDAMRDGDPRSPPLARPQARELPSREELADPGLYSKYEERQQSQVIASFVDVADRRLAELDDAIRLATDLGDSAGLTPEQLKEGKEKRARLDAMRQRLLREHPQPSK